MTTSITLTAKEIAKIKKISLQYVHQRARKERWEYETVTGRGGKQKRYLLDSLPDDIRILYNKEIITDAEITAAVEKVMGPTTPQLPGPAPAVSMAQRSKALAKYDLVRLYRERIAQAAWGQKTPVRDDFIGAYNTGVLYPSLYDALGPVSWKTVEAWALEAKRSREDFYALTDRRGTWRRGESLIGPEHAKILLSCVLHPNKPRIAESIRFAKEILAQRGIPNGYSEDTYYRWLCHWRERNYHIWTYTREGWKAWNDKCALNAERDYDRIEVGDLLVADGHTLNFEIINPWTGKPKRMTLLLWLDMKSSYPLGWEIMPTENTQAIAAALRWAIIRLGKMPKIAYIDNGKAFGARFFEGVNLEQDQFSGIFQRLGMQVIHARPYRGQSKTIERFFGTLGELERWAPTYTGQSIATKPPGMMRGERVHRKLRNQVIGGGISLEQAHAAIAQWFDAYARRPQQEGHLKGIAPIDVFLEGRGPGVDREKLADMMMACEVKHIRRAAISFAGRQYYAEALHGRSHKVMIRYDFQDLSAIRVHELDGELICIADQYQKLHPAARQLGTEADVQLLADHSAEHRRQEREASVLATTFLKDEVLPQHRAQMAQIGIEPMPVAKPAAPSAIKQIPQNTISDEEWARICADADRLEVECDAAVEVVDVNAAPVDVEIEEDAVALRARLEALDEPERYLAIMEMEIRGRLVPERWRDFARYFEDTLAYLKHRDHYEEQIGMLAVQWQAESAGRK